MARTARSTEVVDEFEDFEVDDADNAGVQDITPVQEVDEVEDLGAEKVEVPSPPTQSQLSTTENFYGTKGTTNKSMDIEDLGVQTIEPDEEMWDVAVTEDIGPVFYGSRLISMEKGHRYRVNAAVYEYLYSRGKLVGQ